MLSYFLEFISEYIGSANDSSDTKRFERLHKSALRYVPDYFEQATQEFESAILEVQLTSLDPIEGHQFLRSNPCLIKELNGVVQTVLAKARTHQEEIYKQNDLLRLYELNKEEISKDLEKIIIEHLQAKYSFIMQGVSTIIEQSTAICMEEILTNLDDFKKNLDEHIVHLKCEELEHQITRTIGEKLGSINDFLTRLFITRASESIKIAILKRYTNHLKGNAIGYQLDQYIEELLKVKSFKMSNYGQLVHEEKILTFLSIVRLTGYEQYQENKPSKVLDLFNEIIAFLIPKDNQKIRQTLTQLKDASNKAVLLKKYIQVWNKKSQLHDVLLAASLLFVGFIKVMRHYSSHIRYILISTFSNIFSNKDQFSPSQVLAYLESIQIESIEEEEESREGQRIISKIEAKKIRKEIRKTRINSLNEHIQHKDQLRDFDHIFSTLNIEKAEKLIFEKISEIESKNLIICVSGFTSEDTRKSEEWAAVVKKFPNAEIFGLIWKSSTIDSLLPDSLKDIPKNPLTIIPVIIGVLTADLESNFHSFRSTHDKICGTWDQAYQHAIIAGKNLACYLVHTDIFEGHAISLIGFSLGTLVIMSCIWELEKMKRYDVIYNVLIMGGVAHIDDFYDKALTAISHQITNCYCTTDNILKGPLKYVNPGVNPIGLGPIYKSNNKVKNIDVTSIADGHLSYREKLEEILLKADLHQDLDLFL